MMDIKKVFIISGDESLVSTIKRVSVTGYDICVFAFNNPAEAEENLELVRPELVIFHSDGDSDDCAAKRLAHAAFSQSVPPAILAITELFLPQTHLSLLKLGFTECLVRPLDLDRLRLLVTCNWASRSRERHQPAVDRSHGKLMHFPDVGVFSCYSPRLQHALSVAEKVARRHAPVLIRGETGTGKTLVAKLIHKASSRRHQPFVDINCGALPGNLVESELFGHKKGAFTGADSDHVGRFSAVGQGTLFLDEVDTLPAETQAKLLRVLDQKKFEPVGSNVSQKLQARVIAASNAPLETLVEHHQFRQDLYYRLNVVSIVLPPLRECRDDIGPLVEYHVARLAKEYRQPTPKLDPHLASILQERSWHGNIRELINTVEQMMVLAEGGVLTCENLSGQTGATESSGDECNSPTVLNAKPLEVARNRGELRELLDALKSADNNRSLAAKILGISRVTLYKKLQKYGVVYEAGLFVVK